MAFLDFRRLPTGIRSAIRRFDQEVTSASSRVRIDTDPRDRFGRSTVRLSGSLHPENFRNREMLNERTDAWLREAGAVEVRPMVPIGPLSPPSAG